jgi:putative ABC transport system permease protein
MREKPPLTFSDIALCSLTQRPFRTACLVLLVAVLAFVLFGGSLIAYSLINGTEGLAKRLGADILIVPKGYDQKVEGILLRGEPSTFYMDAEWLDKISSFEGVRAVSPQLFVASLNSSCCSMPIQLIGFEQTTDFVIEPWIRTALPGKLTDDEIVVGGAINGKPGSRLKFFGREYLIAAKMENTGTGFDASIFMNMEAARTAAGDYAAYGGPFPPPAGAISSLSVILDDGYTAGGVTSSMNRYFDYGNSGVVLVPSKAIINNVAGGMRAIVGFVAALAVILWILSIFILAIVFSAMLNERKREFGILRSLGATRKRLMSLVFIESGVVSLFGGAAGVFLAALLILPFRTRIHEAVNMPYMQPSAGQFAALLCASLLLSFAVGPLASLFSSAKMGKGDAFAVIQEGGV